MDSDPDSEGSHHESEGSDHESEGPDHESEGSHHDSEGSDHESEGSYPESEGSGSESSQRDGPEERSGHTAVMVDDKLYVWGGFRFLPDDDVLIENEEMWVYDFEQGAWEMVSMTGSLPPSMSGACGCFLNEHMYLFGGSEDRLTATNQIYRVSLKDGEYSWEHMANVIGSAPSVRTELSCWVYNGRITYFGGYGEKKAEEVDKRSFIKSSLQSGPVLWGYNNEVHSFDPVQASWSQPQTHGQHPGPRSAHASASLGSRGYIFGGKVKENRMNDIHCLDLESWTWSEIIPESLIPAGRSWHTLTAVSNRSLFLFGGLSDEVIAMSDGWLFDVETKTWREVEHPFKDEPRLWHTACGDKNSDVIVFGGCRDFQYEVHEGHCKDLLIFHIQPHSLYRICEDYIVKSYDVLRNRFSVLPPQLLTVIETRVSRSRPSSQQE